MNDQKGLFTQLGETIDRYHTMQRVTTTQALSTKQRGWRYWLGRLMIPNIGTLVLVVVLILIVPSLAAPSQSPAATSISTIPYQGRLADSAGTPVTAMQNMEFRIYDVPTGGTPLWEELWTGGNSVNVSDGLFSVLLGSLEPGLATVVQGHDELYLGVTVGTDSEMSPRVQLGSVPFSMQALTVPDSSITTNKIATSAITTTHLLDGAVTQAKLSGDVSMVPHDGSVTTAKLNIDNDLNMNTHSLVNVDSVISGDADMHIRNPNGTLRMLSLDNVYVFLDSDNSQTTASFRIAHNSFNYDPPVEDLLTLNENGNLWIKGSISQGAIIENNLQTGTELASECIARFSEGDVLCWEDGQLELCSQQSSLLVQAVADRNGKPIIVGAENIKVLGPIQVGDLLVASEVPGYAKSDNDPAPGTVIAQALESWIGDQGMVKAMIRKF